MKGIRLIGLLLVTVSLIAAACGDSVEDQPQGAQLGPVSVDGPASDEDLVSGGGLVSAVGPGISVGEALESKLDGQLLVNGFLVAADEGPVLLAELLAESLPPQAGGATLTIEGLDLGSVEPLTHYDGVTWSDQPIQILGTVDNGVITVSTTSSG